MVVYPQTNYNYQGSTLIYSIIDENYAIVGTNETTAHNAIPSSAVYTSISIPETISYNEKSYTVTEIGVNSFSNYQNLATISFPNTVVQVNKGAFDNALFDVSENLLQFVKFVGVLAFASNNIDHLKIGKSIQYIGSAAFSYSKKSCLIEVDSGNEYFSSDSSYALFDKSKRRLIQVPKYLTSYTIPSTVEFIELSVFAQSSIEEITIPINVKKIGVEAFSDALSLKKVVIHGNIKVYFYSNFQPKIFNGCTSLKNLIYCGSRFVDGDQFADVEISIKTCVGYKKDTFGNRAVTVSNECVALPEYRCTCNVRKVFISYNMLFFSILLSSSLL